MRFSSKRRIVGYIGGEDRIFGEFFFLFIKEDSQSGIQWRQQHMILQEDPIIAAPCEMDMHTTTRMVRKFSRRPFLLLTDNAWTTGGGLKWATQQGCHARIRQSCNHMRRDSNNFWNFFYVPPQIPLYSLHALLK